ncbi:Polyketide cyclase / dehydrase and lipid transport [Phycisphaerae bacterium RAS2]|nr:Polyketide cyclase / dehydrase and lipid transport [Phycisphaerae bacterium RAS2]
MAATSANKKRRPMWQWILVGAGGLAGLVLLIAGVGLLLPQGHVAARRIALRQKPDAVWDVIADFEQSASWRKDLKSVTRQPNRDDRPVWTEDGSNGPMTLERVETARPTRLVTRIADESLPFGGRWIFDIEETADGCRVTITEEGEIYNPIFRCLARFVFGYTSTLESYLKSLGGKFGEDVSPAAP